MTRADHQQLMTRIRACQECAAHLPHPPRPVLRGLPPARILIIGQAPGIRVHRSGIPWDDPSGERLRDWMGVGPEVFYDETRIAIVPMGFCFPGVDARGADRPPRPECAPKWHPAMLAQLPRIEMTLLIGAYAQRRYLGRQRKDSLTATVRSWRDYSPDFLPLPHPSWRNNGWIKRNSWFESEVIASLHERMRALLDSG